MTSKNKIGFVLMMVSLLTMLVALLGYGDNKMFAICYIPLSIGLYLYK